MHPQSKAFRELCCEEEEKTDDIPSDMIILHFAAQANSSNIISSGDGV